MYRYNCCFSSTPHQVSTSRIKWVEAGHACIPALSRFVFMLCVGCLYRQAKICLSLWLKNRSDRLFCPSWLLHWLHQPFNILKETRLTPLGQVQWATETSDRQILKVLELIPDKPSNICSLHKSLKHLGSTKLSINLKQYGFLMIFFPHQDLLAPATFEMSQTTVGKIHLHSDLAGLWECTILEFENTVFSKDLTTCF